MAGENFWYLIKFADDFGNLAVLRTSYVAWRMPFYSTADQNLLLVQVSGNCGCQPDSDDNVKGDRGPISPEHEQ